MVSRVLPLMAVVQPIKSKVKPELDFWEMNGHVSCHTGGKATDICSEMMHKWRQMTRATMTINLNQAYLQLHVNKKLWQHRLV